MTTTPRQKRMARRDVAALRAAGLSVKVHDGALKRGRVGIFRPKGWMVHHDATAKGASPGVVPILIHGRSDLPGPLCQWWLDTKGTWHLIAAGRANHGGRGRGRFLGRNAANSRSMGVECDHTVGEPWKRAQYDALILGLATIGRHRRWKPGNVIGHKEYQPGKVDPALNMTRLRAAVITERRTYHLTRVLSGGKRGYDVDAWRERLGLRFGLEFDERTVRATKARRVKRGLKPSRGQVGGRMARREGWTLRR